MILLDLLGPNSKKIHLHRLYRWHCTFTCHLVLLYQGPQHNAPNTVLVSSGGTGATETGAETETEQPEETVSRTHRGQFEGREASSRRARQSRQGSAVCRFEWYLYVFVLFSDLSC